MKSSLLLIAALCVACTDDLVTSHYATLAAAENDRLFERGWLPKLLPPSSHNIRTTNNLDLNTSSGEFYMAPMDVSGFIRSLNPSAPEQNAVESIPANVTATYTEGRYVWQFTCNSASGHCIYQLQPMAQPGAAADPLAFASLRQAVG